MHLVHQLRGSEGIRQGRSQNTAYARAQRGHTMFASSLVPRPRPAFSRLQYKNAEEIRGGAPPENF